MLHVRVALGGNPGPVVLDLALDTRRVPSQDGCDELGDLGGDGCAPVAGADRYAQAAGQEVVEMQRPSCDAP
jgi:hypothetical protein